MKCKEIERPCEDGSDCNHAPVKLEVMAFLSRDEIEEALNGQNIGLTRKRMIKAGMDTSDYEDEFIDNREPEDKFDKTEKRDDDIAYVPASELVFGDTVCDRCGSDQIYNSDGRNITND